MSTPGERLSLLRCYERVRDELAEEVLPGIQKRFTEANGGHHVVDAAHARELINEAQTRKYLIDPVLESLGWKLGEPLEMLVEAPAEPVDPGAHRRFLDYLGRSQAGECEALLLVEAKRLSLKLPSDVPGQAKNEMIAAAIDAALQGKDGLTETWREILATLADYVRRLEQSANGIPKRVLLTNGEWYIVLSDPKATLIDRVKDASQVFVAASLDEAMERSEQLHKLLSFGELFGTVPPQNCESFRRFAESGGEPLPATYAVEVHRLQFHNARPVFALRPAVVVHINGSASVRFQLDKEPLILRDEEELEDDMAQISRDVELICESLNRYRAIRILDAIEFEKNYAKPSGGYMDTAFLQSEDWARLMVIYLGDISAPIVSGEEFDECIYHAHGAASVEGKAARPFPFLVRSSDPAAYFVSGSPRHCSHLGAKELRDKRCPILRFEEFLCCRSCALSKRCWPDGMKEFPCKIP